MDVLGLLAEALDEALRDVVHDAGLLLARCAAQDLYVERRASRFLPWAPQPLARWSSATEVAEPVCDRRSVPLAEHRRRPARPLLEHALAVGRLEPQWGWPGRSVARPPRSRRSAGRRRRSRCRARVRARSRRPRRPGSGSAASSCRSRTGCSSRSTHPFIWVVHRPVLPDDLERVAGEREQRAALLVVPRSR